MAYEGATTIVGPAVVQELRFARSAAQTPYLYLDVFFEENRKQDEFRRIGLVLFGEDAKRVADFALGGEVMVTILGYITTRPYKPTDEGHERVSTGLAISMASVTNKTGDQFIMLENTKYMAFR